MQVDLAALRATRTTQLGLTLLAALLSIGAYVLVTVGTTGAAPPGVAGFVAVFAGSYLLAHLVVVRFAAGADPVMLPTAALLAGLGYAVIFGINPDLAASQFGWLMLGLALFALTLIAIRDHRSLDAYTYTIGLAGIILLLLPITPGLGQTINGARLWIRLGPLNFQPAEVAKVLLVVFLASYLGSKKELLALATRRIGPFHVPEPKHFGPLILAWLVSLAVLFLERDLGSSLLFFGIFVVMLWMATARSTYLAIGTVLFVAGALIGYATFGHVQDRVTVWVNALDPEYIQDEGFQLAQSQFALATGGLAGEGLGQGHPELISPGGGQFAATDFIFSVIGEELGLFGTTAVLLLYVLLIGRGFRAALRRDDAFGKLLAGGLAATLALQTFIIVGGVTRLIPLTGITLPFVSYGGSSLVANFVLLALLVRITSPAPRHASGGARLGRTR